MVDEGIIFTQYPELRFGRDDKFEITFNRLGRTDENQMLQIKVSYLILEVLKTIFVQHHLILPIWFNWGNYTRVGCP